MRNTLLQIMSEHQPDIIAAIAIFFALLLVARMIFLFEEDPSKRPKNNIKHSLRVLFLDGLIK